MARCCPTAKKAKFLFTLHCGWLITCMICIRCGPKIFELNPDFLFFDCLQTPKWTQSHLTPFQAPFGVVRNWRYWIFRRKWLLIYRFVIIFQLQIFKNLIKLEEKKKQSRWEMRRKSICWTQLLKNFCVEI